MSGAVSGISPDGYIQIINCNKGPGVPCRDDEDDAPENSKKWSNYNRKGASLYTDSELSEVSKLESEKTETLLDTIQAQSKLQSIHMRAQNRGISSSIDSLVALGQIGSKSGSAADSAKKGAGNSSKITNNNSSDSNSSSSNNSGGFDASVLKSDLSGIRNAINAGGSATALKEIAKILKDDKSSAVLKEIADAVKAGSSAGSLSSALSSITDSLNSNTAELAKIGAELGKLTKFQDDYLKNQGEFLKIEQDRHKFETTKQSIRDLDGQEVANMSPREIEASKNASEARIATDTNNFELDSSDIDDLFGDLPDITDLFKTSHFSDVAKEYLAK